MCKSRACLGETSLVHCLFYCGNFRLHFRRSHAHALDQPDSSGFANFVLVQKVAAIFPNFRDRFLRHRPKYPQISIQFGAQGHGQNHAGWGPPNMSEHPTDGFRDESMVVCLAMEGTTPPSYELSAIRSAWVVDPTTRMTGSMTQPRGGKSGRYFSKIEGSILSPPR